MEHRNIWKKLLSIFADFLHENYGKDSKILN